MDNEILIAAAFPGAGLLAYVIIPGMLFIWDRVLDHMEHGEETRKVLNGRGDIPCHFLR